MGNKIGNHHESVSSCECRTVDEAIALLESVGGRARVIAGGTDLLGILKTKSAGLPETLINLKSNKNLEYIREDGGF